MIQLPVTGASAEYHTAGGGVWHDYFSVEGMRIGKRIRAISPATISHQRYIQDHLGSVVAVLNNSGSMIQKLSYDAWGLRRYPSGAEDASSSISAPVSRGYTDHEHLPGSRLINMNARMYDPELGRFLSADPYIPNPMRSQAYNRYSYVYNNPLRYIDPSGYNPDCAGCPVIIVTPGGGGFGSGWSLSDWDLHGESHYWSHGGGGGGGFVDGTNPNVASTYYRGGGIARTEATTIQGNRPINSRSPRFEMIVALKKDQTGSFSRFVYPNGRLSCFFIACASAQDNQARRVWYDSEEAAAIAALNSANPLSIQHNSEFGGLIYKNYFIDQYSYTTRYTDWVRDTVNVEARLNEVPWFAKIVAEYHTHGSTKGFRPGISGDLNNLGGYNAFSPQDIDRANALGRNAYLGTPSAGYFKYSPSQKLITPLP